MSTSHDKTLKLVTNLDRAAVEARIAEVRKAAQSANLGDLATALAGLEGKSRGEIEARVRSALKLLADKPQHQQLFAQLELIELNLPNLK
jgi:hypothetical protein